MVRNTGGPLVALVLVIGSLLALSGHVLHPKDGVTPEAIVAHPEWGPVHLAAAAGYALVGAGALALLTGPVRSGADRALLAVFAAGSALLAVSLAVDGGANPVLAEAVVAGGDDAAFRAFHEIARITGSTAFAMVGVAGAGLAVAEARASQRAWRAGAVLGAIGFIAIAGAGVLVIGAEIAALSPLFAGGILSFAWFAAHALRRDATPTGRARSAVDELLAG